MKRELNDARKQIQDSLTIFLDGCVSAEVNEQIRGFVTNGFAPLYEELASRTRKSVVLAQVGTAGYRVEKTTNFLDLRMGMTIQRDEVEKLIADGVTVHVTRNK